MLGVNEKPTMIRLNSVLFLQHSHWTAVSILIRLTFVLSTKTLES